MKEGLSSLIVLGQKLRKVGLCEVALTLLFARKVLIVHNLAQK